MVSYIVAFVVYIAILALILFILHTDMKRQGISGGTYWGWLIAIVILFIYSWLILIGVLIAYYIWSRHFQEES